MAFQYTLSNMKVEYLYEDDWYLAIDKPPGLLTIPAPGKKRSLTELLNRERARAGSMARLNPCHRLDGETSGVLLFAKGKKAQKLMMALFHAKKVHKLYIALVQGRLEKDAGIITRHLEGKPAITRYRVLERFPLCTVVEVEPETGRTNQIRLHFKGIGHPLVGETRYAFRKDFPLSIPRLMLHASELTFPHPVTSLEVRIQAPIPSDMVRVLEKVRAS